MKEFPAFMKNPLNAISSSQQSKGVEGYIFDGVDESQMAFWECTISEYPMNIRTDMMSTL